MYYTNTYSTPRVALLGRPGVGPSYVASITNMGYTAKNLAYRSSVWRGQRETNWDRDRRRVL